MQFGHVAQGPGFQQVENRGLTTVKHDQVGFHGLAAHLDPVGRLTCSFLVNGPNHRAILFGETVALQDYLVLDMFFIGNALEQEMALQVCDQMIAGRALEGQENRTSRRMLGEKFAMQQQAGLAVNGRKTVAYVALTKLFCVVKAVDHLQGQLHLCCCLQPVDICRSIPGHAPVTAQVAGGGQGQPGQSGKACHLTGHFWFIRQQVLPGLQPVRPQGGNKDRC